MAQEETKNQAKIQWAEEDKTCQEEEEGEDLKEEEEDSEEAEEVLTEEEEVLREEEEAGEDLMEGEDEVALTVLVVEEVASMEETEEWILTEVRFVTFSVYSKYMH